MVSEKKDTYWRAYLIYFGFVILMLVVFIKTITIQLDNGDKEFTTSTITNKKLPTRIVKRAPRRGQILDANYTPLVTSISFYDIHMDPTVIKDKLFNKEIHQLSIELSALFQNKTAKEYEIYIKSGRENNKRYL
mgnify:FL=1